jgi:hypothetical protein
MYWLLAFGMHALIGWIDRSIAAARYQERWDAAPASTTQPPPAVMRPEDHSPTG